MSNPANSLAVEFKLSSPAITAKYNKTIKHLCKENPLCLFASWLLDYGLWQITIPI